MEEGSSGETCELSNELSILRIDDSGLTPGEKREPLYVDKENGVIFRQYESEADLDCIVPLITKDLSEPYSLYTYRYFIYNWPKLCILVGP